MNKFVIFIFLLLNITSIKSYDSLDNITVPSNKTIKLSYNEYCITLNTHSSDKYDLSLFIIDNLIMNCTNQETCNIEYNECCENKNFFSIEITNKNNYDIDINFKMLQCDEYESYISGKYDSYVIHYVLWIFIPVILILFIIFACSLWKICTKKPRQNLLINQV